MRIFTKPGCNPGGKGKANGVHSMYKSAALVIMAFVFLSVTLTVQNGKDWVHHHDYIPSGGVSGNRSGVKGDVPKGFYPLNPSIGRKLLQSAPDPESDECAKVNGISDQQGKCEYVLANKACHIKEGMINYTKFVYCDQGHIMGGAMTLLVLWWILLFISLAVTADDFFCPAVVVIVKVLGISPNVAGVTFLAFGNGGPDLFSAIAAFMSMEKGDGGMAIGGLFGAGMFVTCVIVGTISIIKPFKAMERPFLRDVIFYLCGCYWMFNIIWREVIYLWEAVGFVIYYVVYVLVVVISGSVYKAQQANIKGQAEVVLTKASTKEGEAINGDVVKPATDLDEVVKGPGGKTLVKSPTSLSILDQGKDNPSYVEDGVDTNMNKEKRLSLTAEETGADLTDLDLEIKASDMELSTSDKEQEAVPEPEDIPPLKAFLMHINPINVDEWADMKIYIKVFEIIKAVPVFLLTITIPVVNYEMENKNWNRHVRCMQLIISPPLMPILFMQLGFNLIGGVMPVAVIFLIIGVVLAAIVYFTSENNTPPRYHEVFGFFAFLMSMVWIYTVATEIVNLLTTFGVVMNVSSTILGVTLLAWGNCVADFAADMAMTRQGYPRMAFAACFGAPIFHLQMGTGIPILIRLLSSGESSEPINLTTQLFILNAFIMGTMCLTLIALMVLKFKARRPYGIFLNVIYVVFMVIIIMAEIGVFPAKIPGHRG